MMLSSLMLMLFDGFHTYKAHHHHCMQAHCLHTYRYMHACSTGSLLTRCSSAVLRDTVQAVHVMLTAHARVQSMMAGMTVGPCHAMGTEECLMIFVYCVDHRFTCVDHLAHPC